ncbi:hypothetical protein ACGFX4_12205 [Kitasatospora sp. NPDC048365]|uniref:hypothetical protein n=1 Tax=Kitasatospora sp. NPDC048365 TaxID=3364050 RepID=UPI003710CF9A
MTGAVAVLAGPGDAGAEAVAGALAARLGGDRVHRLTPARLARARWSHRVGPDGRARTRISLPDGTVLDSAEPGAVLHRLTHLPVPGLARAGAKDRDYARTEILALLASWLLSLGGRVLGTVSAYGTVQGPVSPEAALAHAARRGLPVARRGGATRAGLLGRPGPAERVLPHLAWPGGASAPVPADLLPALRPDPDGRLLLCGDGLVGPLAARYGPQARELGAALGTGLLELRFAEGRLTDVDTCPPLDLPAQRAAVVRALAELAGEV